MSAPTNDLREFISQFCYVENFSFKKENLLQMIKTIVERELEECAKACEQQNLLEAAKLIRARTQ